MTFDQNGHLFPYEVIETTLEVFEDVFVKSFPTSSTRSVIFAEYLTYLNRLQQIIGKEFYQWIDGSFTTQKLNPRDIDIVTFIEASLFDANEPLLRDLIIYAGCIYLVEAVKRNQKELFIYNY